MEDKVWGIFKADNQTRQIWDLMQSTLQKQGFNTDIIYSDNEFALAFSVPKSLLFKQLGITNFELIFHWELEMA